MSVDLKRQASDLYRERDELGNIRTSDPLSLKRIVYASLGVVILALIAVQIFGGFSRRKDPIAAATAPPQVIKEAPPPELLQESAAEPLSDAPAVSDRVQTPQQRTAGPKPTAPAVVKAGPDSAPPAPAAAAPAVVAAQPRGGPAPSSVPRPGGRSQPKQGPRLVRDAKPAEAASSQPAGKDVGTKAPAPPPQPAMSELEQTRRQLAREIVLESNSAISTLVSGPRNRGWKADPIGADEYNVVFTIMDQATGTPVQYIWKVNLSTRAVTPLSYYARKLS